MPARLWVAPEPVKGSITAMNLLAYCDHVESKENSEQAEAPRHHDSVNLNDETPAYILDR